jgi:hypothetical protein
MAEIRTHDTLIMSSTLYLLRHQCFVLKCTSLWYIYHVCPWTSGSLYVIKLTTNLPGLPYGYTVCLRTSQQYNAFTCGRFRQYGPDIGHILFLRILYHIPYHGQKSDIISYPISRLKKG